MKSIIRKMEERDFDKIMDIFTATDFGCIGLKELFKPGKQEQMMMMREVLEGQSQDEEIIVLEENGQVVGYTTIHEQGDIWHIGQIAITSECRKQGKGKKMLDQIQKLAQKRKKDIWLECFEKENLFFLKQGFEKIKEDSILTFYRWNYNRNKEFINSQLDGADIIK